MNRSLIIRLIDVVLILLFGFLAISDIQMKRQIRLPGPAEDSRQIVPADNVWIFVKIDSAGHFSVLQEAQLLQQTASLDTLRTALLAASGDVYAAGSQPVVIIDPHPEATVQATISVFDICEAERLPKSINMQVDE
ncbi:MAG: biopolymer transporter ExbD [Calditrichaeota bacterium]|nr:biopolymer transporter ExbD [Calditrichota bacterium]MCB0305316.1 biopolymer transporter ExbD [Calditrichota bacterium]